MEEDPRRKKRKSHKAGREGEAKKVAVDTSEVGGKKRRENIDRFRPFFFATLVCVATEKKKKNICTLFFSTVFILGKTAWKIELCRGVGLLEFQRGGGGGKLKGGLKLKGKVVVVKWGVRGKRVFRKIWSGRHSSFAAAVIVEQTNACDVTH